MMYSVLYSKLMKDLRLMWHQSPHILPIHRPDIANTYWNKFTTPDSLIWYTYYYNYHHHIRVDFLIKKIQLDFTSALSFLIIQQGHCYDSILHEGQLCILCCIMYNIILFCPMFVYMLCLKIYLFTLNKICLIFMLIEHKLPKPTEV